MLAFFNRVERVRACVFGRRRRHTDTGGHSTLTVDRRLTPSQVKASAAAAAAAISRRRESRHRSEMMHERHLDD